MREKVAENHNGWMSEPESSNIESKVVVPKKQKKLLRNSSKVLLPLIGGIVFVLLWEFQIFHTIFNLKTYQLPLPSVILEALQDNISTLLSFTGYTLTEAVLGMLVGSSLGFILALVATAWPKWGKGGLLIVVSLNAIPIVALAPIMNLWFGDGIGSRVAIVTVTTMAAMAINAYKGMTNVNPKALNLMHS